MKSRLVPSVGGTVSIFTKARLSSVQQVVGNDGYTKTFVRHSTGLSDNGWDISSVLLSKWKVMVISIIQVVRVTLTSLIRICF